jgi:hypothetical protein
VELIPGVYAATVKADCGTKMSSMMLPSAKHGTPILSPGVESYALADKLKIAWEQTPDNRRCCILGIADNVP